jgi:hypothetical protein
MRAQSYKKTKGGKRIRRRVKHSKRIKRLANLENKVLTARNVRTLVKIGNLYTRGVIPLSLLDERMGERLKRLAACQGQGEVTRGRRVVKQTGGLLPFLPLLLAAGPLIGKALLGVGASAAASAVGSSIAKAINKRK